jgi:hypothetical protein
VSFVDGMIYGFGIYPEDSYAPRLIALNAATDKLAWRKSGSETGTPKHWFDSAPFLSDGVLYTVHYGTRGRYPEYTLTRAKFFASDLGVIACR